MTSFAKKTLTAAMAILLTGSLAACGSMGASKKALVPADQSGFLSGYYEKLEPGTAKGDPKFLWIKPGIEYTKYKKVMVDYVTFALADDSDYKGINANDMKELADLASLALIQELQKKMPVVSEPGPDVLRVRTAIVDLRQSKPAMSVISTVVPVGAGISLIKKGATGTWTGAGATKAEMMVMDSMTNEVIGAGIDEKEAGFTERYTKWGSFEESFRFWGERLARRIEGLTTK